MSIQVKPQPKQTEPYRDDRWDEVWDGELLMSPSPNDPHQELQANFLYALMDTVTIPNLGRVRAGGNVSDRAQNWTKNYRCPDVIVYLNTNPAINHGTHWEGGPDFLVEILSPGDRALQKLPFYASINTREVLIIDRDPWQLSLYQLQQQQLILIGESDTSIISNHKQQRITADISTDTRCNSAQSS